MTVFAVMQHVEYVGSFVESLWSTEVLALEEIILLETKYPRRRGEWEIETWEIHFERREEGES